ncbi:QueT transporter family protein [Vallitalea guaymasensis]|uniref:QueT transporter family protein n=1 Tax=Vallitalea guaymasensis TaxID=1185412 RepID=A0A8J8MAV9_9FIRM|nr:QueT transporter family protein [Vallitalea guaymasensis]QUH29552.1 QueT transporter family protein [Vallitalea guaymasensis]
MNRSTKFLTQAGLIAAIYVVFTLPFASFGTDYMQVRISEALTILPFFTPAAIPGLSIGCLLSNIFISKFGMVDIVFGSLATLIAAYLSYRLRRKKGLVPIPPIIVNAFIVGALIYFGTFGKLEFNATLFSFIAWVGLGQFIACYGIGFPLLLVLDKYKNKIFR